MPEKATDEGSVSRSGLIVGVPAGTGVGAVGAAVGVSVIEQVCAAQSHPAAQSV